MARNTLSKELKEAWKRVLGEIRQIHQITRINKMHDVSLFNDANHFSLLGHKIAAWGMIKPVLDVLENYK